MNIKNLLITCDIEKAAELHFVLQEPPKSEDWEGFLRAHLDFANEIAGIQAIPGDYVILGSKILVACDPFQQIQLYRKKEIEEKFCRCEAWEGDRPLERYTDAELEQISPNALGYVFPDAYDMETMPWEELLGAEVFSENVDAFGQELMAALVIREMSYWGLSYERSRQGQRRLRERIEKAVQGEWFGPFASFEELMKALNDPSDGDDDKLPAVDEQPVCDATVVRKELSPADQVRASIAKYRQLLRYIENGGVDE